jgi:hypothetical protein
VPDYAAKALLSATSGPSGPVITLDAATLTSGVYTYGSNVKISGTLGAGKNVTIVVTGSGHDAYIDGNIDYAAYTLATVPRLSVYVQDGNIMVDSSVDHIHGFFSALKTDPGTGVFYTCGKALNLSYSLATDATAYDNCNHKLTIFGAVSADSINLGRTWGTLGGATGVPAEPAEVFQYSPELWLAQPSSSASAGASPYNSITSLPPVL